jgi:hypothetical protein
MRARFQRGYLRLGERKTGCDCWEYLWWDSEPTGQRVRREAVIGTVRQYPNLEDAWQASNGLRVSTLLREGAAHIVTYGSLLSCSVIRCCTKDSCSFV